MSITDAHQFTHSHLNRLLELALGHGIRDLSYDDEVSLLNLDTLEIKDRKAIAERSRRLFPSEEELRQLPLDKLVRIVALLIEAAPAYIDFTYDVDGAGTTMHIAVPKLSTGWVRISNDYHIRLSQSRVARHSSGVIRTPIESGGFVLEASRFPLDDLPLDTVTLLVFKPPRDTDLRFPYILEKPAEVYDLSGYTTRPFTAGPLYNGYPSKNLVTGEQLAIAREALIELVVAVANNRVI